MIVRSSHFSCNINEPFCVHDFQRSLAPLFSKVSTSSGQEATVPQIEKSPLTCIKSKVPCDRDVPETDRTVRSLVTAHIY